MNSPPTKILKTRQHFSKSVENDQLGKCLIKVHTPDGLAGKPPRGCSRGLLKRQSACRRSARNRTVGSWQKL